MLVLMLSSHQANVARIQLEQQLFDARQQELFVVDALITHRIEEEPAYGSASLDAMRRRVVSRTLDPLLLAAADFKQLHHDTGLSRIALSDGATETAVFETARTPPCRQYRRLVRVREERTLLLVDFCEVKK